MKRVLISDIENSVGSKTDEIISSRILRDNLAYRPLNKEEFEEYILDYLKVLNTDLTIAGKHRKENWENGWSENLNLFNETRDINSLIPKYHTKSNISRLNNEIIKTFDPQFDFKLHSYMVDAILHKAIRDFDEVYEFGCGTGYHLFRFAKLFTQKFIGLDWSVVSQDIIKNVSEKTKLNVIGKNFDYFNPDYDINIKNKLVYTIASLEQIGENHSALLDFLIEKKPGLCIHFEPIAEVLLEDNLLDYLTLQYFKKRNYLKNYLTALQLLEQQDKLKILNVRRLNYGSKFIEGHTMIIWKPNHR